MEGKQTLDQFALKYGVNEKTIRRDLEDMRYVQKIWKYKQVTTQMGMTYWGRRFGLMVIRDAVRGRALWRKYVTHETIADYMEGVNWIKSKGFILSTDGIGKAGSFHVISSSRKGKRKSAIFLLSRKNLLIFEPPSGRYNKAGLPVFLVALDLYRQRKVMCFAKSIVVSRFWHSPRPSSAKKSPSAG